MCRNRRSDAARRVSEKSEDEPGEEREQAVHAVTGEKVGESEESGGYQGSNEAPFLPNGDLALDDPAERERQLSEERLQRLRISP